MPTLSLTYTAPQANRIAAYYGDLLGLGRDATAAEIKAEIWNTQRLGVAAYEKRKAEIAAIATAAASLTDLGTVT
jgi:hypothetical protein